MNELENVFEIVDGRRCFIVGPENPANDLEILVEIIKEGSYEDESQVFVLKSGLKAIGVPS